MPFGLSKKEFFARTLNKSGASSVLRRLPHWNGLLVLNYHRIGSPNGSPFDHNLWSATEDDFAGQVRLLTQNFDVIGIRDLDDVFEKKSGKYALITFDDGYLDNFELAFPILKAYGAAATFFITTGFLDDRRMAWWDEICWMIRTSTNDTIPANKFFDQSVSLNDADDPDRSKAADQFVKVYWTLSPEQTTSYLDLLAELTGSGRCPSNSETDPWMTWDHAREMHSAGMDIAAHTVNHPVLSQLSGEQQSFEIRESKRRVEQEIGSKVVALSYPVGGREMFNSATRMAMQRAGIRYGFSYYGDFCKFHDVDTFDIPRFPVELHTTMPFLQALTALPQVFT